MVKLSLKQPKGAPLKVSPRRFLSKHKKKLLLLITCISFVVGVYLLVLLIAPAYPTAQDSLEDFKASALSTAYQQQKNTIIIPKIGVETEIFEGDESSLEKGPWHRYHERGGPDQVGNFVVTAHRFTIGLTPEGTRRNSPFYNLHKLEQGDEIVIAWEGEEYTYKVFNIFEVDPYALDIEAQTDERILTIYSCTLKGRYDGRIVIKARPA